MTTFSIVERTFMILLIDSPATRRTSDSLSSQETSNNSIASVNNLGNSLMSLLIKRCYHKHYNLINTIIKYQILTNGKVLNYISGTKFLTTPKINEESYFTVCIGRKSEMTLQRLILSLTESWASFFLRKR